MDEDDVPQIGADDDVPGTDAVDLYDIAWNADERQPEEEDASAEEEDRQITIRIVCLLNGVGLLGLIGWAISTWAAWLSVLSSGLLLGGASFCSGALLGLLFGMPRGPFRKGAGTKLENTNLVQISDWLTKALVGAGLTEAHNLGNALTRIGSTYGGELRSSGVVISILIYYTIAGFFSGWLITRFFVEGMLHRLHRRTSSDGTEQRDQNPNPETKRKQAQKRSKRRPKAAKEPKK